MTTRRASRPRRRVSTRKPTSWYNNASVPANAVGGAQGFFDLTPLARLQTTYHAGFTCVRLIARLTMGPSGINQDITASIGVAVVSRDAVTAGVLPDPGAELADWYLEDDFFDFNVDLTPKEHSYDIRSARMIRGEARTLVFVIDNTGVNTLRWSFRCRMVLMH